MTILFPTEMEARPYIAAGVPSGVNVVISGVGGIATAYSTMKAARQYGGPMVLAGIAGCYTGSLAVGDVVAVSGEREGDLGVWRDGEFGTLPCADKGMELVCEDARRVVVHGVALRAVEAVSVNVAGAEFVARGAAEIENMEGAAFFYVCIRENIKFLEVRAISNVVGAAKDSWDIPLATERLAEVLRSL